MIDYFQTLHSKNGESCAWKQIVVVILCSVNVVFCKGQVGLAHRTLLKGVLVRLAKSCLRRCFGNGQRNCGIGLENLWRSFPAQTILTLSLYVNLHRATWVPHSGPFMSGGRRATLPAVFLVLFEEDWAVLGLSLVAWVVGFYLFSLRWDWRKFALDAFHHKSADSFWNHTQHLQ